MRMSSCTTLPGVTHASIEYSPVDRMRFLSFALEPVEACALPPAKLAPAAEPLHAAGQRQVHGGIDAARVVGNRAAPVIDVPQSWPVLNSYRATTLAS